MTCARLQCRVGTLSCWSALAHGSGAHGLRPTGAARHAMRARRPHVEPCARSGCKRAGNRSMLRQPRLLNARCAFDLAKGDAEPRGCAPRRRWRFPDRSLPLKRGRAGIGCARHSGRRAPNSPAVHFEYFPEPSKGRKAQPPGAVVQKCSALQRHSPAELRGRAVRGRRSHPRAAGLSQSCTFAVASTAP